jgi:hypothetical protein
MTGRVGVGLELTRQSASGRPSRGASTGVSELEDQALGGGALGDCDDLRRGEAEAMGGGPGSEAGRPTPRAWRVSAAG